MTEIENKEAVLRRVQKLLAIAGDDRANPNEAAAAAGMAEKIMRKYQIEHSDVIISALKIGDDLGMSESVASAKTNGTKIKVAPPWVNMLAVAVGRFNDCGVRIGRNAEGNASCRFYGFTADVQVAKWAFDYLVATTLRLCSEFKKTDHYLIEGRTAVNSYRQGVVSGIISQLTVLTRAKAEEAEQSTTGTALVVVKQAAITEKYGNFGYTTKELTLGNQSAFSTGVAHGKQINVSTRAISSQGAVKALR